MTIASPTSRIFRPTPAQSALGAVIIAAGTAALAFAAGAGVLLLLRGTLPRSIVDILITVVIVVVVALGLLLMATRLTTRIVVDPGEVRVERLGRVFRRWDRATSQFGSRAVRSGDVGSTTARHLVVTGPGTVDDYQLWRFTGEQFSALVALLATPRPMGVDAAVAPRATTSSGLRDFVLDRGPIVRLARRRAVLGVVSILFFLVLALFVLDALAADDPDFPRLPALVIPVVVFLGLSAFIVAQQVIAVRRVPQRIQVSPSTLRIDDRDFPLGSLARIDVTPASYTTGPRTLVLVPTDGSAASTFSLSGLGLTPVKRHAVFPDYPNFVDAVVTASAWRGSEFVRFLLG